MSRHRRRAGKAPTIGAIARRPALILLALLVVLAANTGLAFTPLAGWQFTGNLVLAGVSVALIGLVFMELDRETALNRLFATVGLAFFAIFAMLIFADYMTRM